MRSPGLSSVAATAGVALVALLTAGCSSSSSHRPHTAAQASAASSCVAQATKNAQAAAAPLALVKPAAPLRMAADRRKAIWVVAASTDEFVADVDHGVAAAAKASAMTAHFVQANGNVTQMGALVHEAVTAKANGIVLFNIPPQAVSADLAAARSAHITVIDYNNGEPQQALEPGIYAHVTSNYARDGRAMADWMLMDTSCRLHVATFELPTYPVDADEIQATIAEIRRLCPTTCSDINTDFDLATFATTLGPQVHTVVAAHPSINFVDPGFDSFVGLVSPVLQQSSSHVSLVGHDGSQSNLAAMKAHSTLQVMTDAQPPEPYIGWVLVDQLGRGMAHQRPAPWVIPARIVDLKNIAAGTDASLFPAYAHFESAFMTAWGLG